MTISKVLSLLIITAALSSLITYRLVLPSVSGDQSVSSVSEEAEKFRSSTVRCPETEPQELATTGEPQRDGASKGSGDADPDEVSKGGPEMSEELRDSIKKQESHINRLRSFSDGVAKDELSDNVSSQYQAERVDFEWAAQEESRLSSLFDNSGALSDYYPESISCRSSNCEIVVPLQSMDDESEVYQLVHEELIADDEEYSQSTITSISNNQRGTVSLYLSKNHENTLFDGSND